MYIGNENVSVSNPLTKKKENVSVCNDHCQTSHCFTNKKKKRNKRS